MKILHLLQTNRFSGAENVVSQIIGIFQGDTDIEMVYCSRDGQIRDALDERGIQFAPIESLSVQEVKRVIREQKPDIIHAHDMRAGFVAARACGKIPLISHIHNNNFNSRGLSAKSLAYFLAAKKARHIFWVSQSSFEGYVFHKHFKNKSSVLYNIIDVDALYQKMKTDPNRYDYDVIYVGRLTYPKNPQRLMRVLAQIKENYPGVKMAVVGTGDLEEETKALSRELNLADNVQFLGFQSNPLKMLRDAKVMIMTSRWEGTPMCALEAMALGVPIVSTPTDGLCELITNDVTGYLSDADDEIAKKTCQILLDNTKWQSMSQHSRELSVKMNNIDFYKDQILKSYEKGNHV